jgi:hypothetical protein
VVAALEAPAEASPASTVAPNNDASTLIFIFSNPTEPNSSEEELFAPNTWHSSYRNRGHSEEID